MRFLKSHRAICLALAAAALLALLPVLGATLIIGHEWRGVPQSYGDEVLYFNQIHEIADGHFWYGNQYLLERSGGPPLVLFAGHWLAAIPLLLGLPFVPTLVFNDILWSVFLVALGYWLLRELDLPKSWSAVGSLLSYLTCFGLMLRPSSRQEVYPFFILFYIALVRFLKSHETRSARIFLAVALGATFYVFSYLWQTAVITMGLLMVFAIYNRYWPLLRSSIIAAVGGVALGLPQLAYMFYLYKTYPYFLESLARFGLVHTHLPEAEIVYSGGWVGVVLLLLAFLWWRALDWRENSHVRLAVVFAAITGMTLWIMEGSNLLTGQLLETGEHIRPFIGPWIPLAALPIFFLVCTVNHSWRTWERFAIALCAAALLVACGIFMRDYLYPYFNVAHYAALWKEEQGFAAPLAWIDAEQAEPVVIWTGPHDPITPYVPTLSRDYVLYSQGAIFTLTPDSEIRERYLVASYFDNPSKDDLRQNLAEFVGRGDAYHRAKTIERGVKICRALYFWNASLKEGCGVPPTSADLLGNQLFAGMEQKLTDDIRPHIRSYLAKYHVSYIIKDTMLDPQMNPQALGARKVWEGGRYEIYRFAWNG